MPSAAGNGALDTKGWQLLPAATLTNVSIALGKPMCPPKISFLGHLKLSTPSDRMKAAMLRFTFSAMDRWPIIVCIQFDIGTKPKSLSNEFPMRRVCTGRPAQSETVVGRIIALDKPMDVCEYRPHLGCIAMAQQSEIDITGVYGVDTRHD